METRKTKCTTIIIFTATVLLTLNMLQTTFGQSVSPDVTAEAENGILTGGLTIAQSTPGYSGTGYITNFKSSSDKVTVTKSVKTDTDV